jgi:hypothetical protein
VTGVYNTAGLTGTGMHVGIAGQTYFPKTDVDNFRAAAGLSATKLNMVCISSANCTSTAGESVGDIPEADLDVEWSGGIAPDATVDFVYASAADASQHVLDAAIYLVTSYQVGGGVVPVISLSYGGCESDVSASDRASIADYLLQAATQGQTILNSSGDAGATGCDQGSTVATGGLAVDYPASEPYVTGVGGTTFAADGSAADPQTGANQYWSYSSTADIIDSALQYISESSWNDTAYEQLQSSKNTLSSGGGGVSQIYPLPTWQWAPSNYSGNAGRYVPDVSFSSSPDHDGYLVCTQAFPTGATSASQSTGSTCVMGFRDAAGYLTVYGGTSASSPSFAGVLTLMVQQYGKLGAFNQTLYNLANDPATYATVFHDIASGSNAQPCTVSSTDCSTGTEGYDATTGFDLVTGLGSIDAYQLYNALGAAAVTPVAATVSVQLSPSSITLGGSSTISITAGVASNQASPVAIPGQVTFLIGSTVLGSASLSSGTATLSNVAVTAANGFSSGPDTITVLYPGSMQYASGSGTAALTVSLAPSYTLSAAASSLSLSPGGSGTVTLSLAAATNYTGTVSFTTAVSSSNGTAAAVTAAAPSVSFASSSNGSTTLTISTTNGAALHPPTQPWTTRSGGALLLCIVLLGAPFARRNRRRSIALALSLAALALIGGALACGGGGSSTPKVARTYTITVTPSGSGTVTNAAAVSLTVTVQ